VTRRRWRLLVAGMLLIVTGNSMITLARVTDSPTEFIIGWLVIWAVTGAAGVILWRATGRRP
jgi:hypothetical protein